MYGIVLYPRFGPPCSMCGAEEVAESTCLLCGVPDI
jgi:hypothetical protein